MKLTVADSRTGYGTTERRTYSSTTGAYGGSSMGGQFWSLSFPSLRC